MEKIMVVIKDDRNGEISSGYLLSEFTSAKVGDHVEIVCRDENGILFEASGRLEDISYKEN
jgi:hypothetical protein